MNIKNIIKEFIDKKRIAFTSIITLLVVITGLYTTYALNIFVDEGTPDEYDIALNFDLSSSVNRQMIVPAGKTKIFDVDITNPYSDSIKYGIAYTMVDPTTKPADVIIAQTNITKNPAVGPIGSSDTVTVSVIVVNNSTSNITVSFSVINGYKNGGELIVPTGKTLITDTYEISPPFRYLVNPNCTDTTATFDYTRNRIIISNTTTSGNITCSPIKSKTELIKFNDYIISLLGENTSVGSYNKFDDNGNLVSDGSTLEKITENGEEDYRYRGINPNNYIMFNNELWRIIGVFDDNTHGIENTHLVKIIRNDSIGAYVWDNRTTVADTETTTNGWNNYPNSDIYNILNTAYYNHIDATGEEYCYSNQTSLTGKCDFRKIGIQTEYQSMVESGVNWFLGGYSAPGITRSTMYKRERSTNRYIANNVTTKEAGLTVPVGLMYASDYGYAAPMTCTSNLSAYNTEGCANKNWLKSNNYEWTITPHTTYDIVSYVYYSGIVANGGPAIGHSTRPSLYLKSNVYYISGTGTQTDPYIISV